MSENDKVHIYGEVVRRISASEMGASKYIILGDDGIEYYCHYADILTEGFRTMWVGERVRFIPSETSEGPRATYILRVNANGKDLYYQS